MALMVSFCSYISFPSHVRQSAYVSTINICVAVYEWVLIRLYFSDHKIINLLLDLHYGPSCQQVVTGADLLVQAADDFLAHINSQMNTTISKLWIIHCRSTHLDPIYLFLYLAVPKWWYRILPPVLVIHGHTTSELSEEEEAYMNKKSLWPYSVHSPPMN